METINTDILKKQSCFFDNHPFPGLKLDHIKTAQQFIYMLEKNELYRAIKRLVKSGDHVLDAGCGTGEFTTYLSMNSGAEVIGIDYSERTIEWANAVKEKINPNGNLFFKKADIFKLTSEDYGFFDFMLAMGLFPSIPNELTGMKKLAKVLRPGGIAIFGFFDPVGRAYIRFKRFLLQCITKNYQEQTQICKNIILKHINDINEIIWHINQLTEEFLNYHSPKEAALMMEKCGIEITDCFPRVKTFGSVIPIELNINGFYRIPLLQVLGQLNWLRSHTDGYYVLAGRKK